MPVNRQTILNEGMKRTILIILSNRYAPNQEPRFFEVDCEDDGTVLEERRLKRRPKQADYDEVWQNDEGKQSLDDCNRMKRIYGHSLQKP